MRGGPFEVYDGHTGAAIASSPHLAVALAVAKAFSSRHGVSLWAKCLKRCVSSCRCCARARESVSALIPTRALRAQKRNDTPTAERADWCVEPRKVQPVARVVGPLRLDWLRFGVWFPVTGDAARRLERWRRELDEVNAAQRLSKQRMPGETAAAERWVSPEQTVEIGEFNPEQARLTPGSYPYGLTVRSGDADIAVAWGVLDGDGKAPTCLVTIHPKVLVTGAVDAVENAIGLCRWLCGQQVGVRPLRTSVSRIDVCVDLQTDAIRARWLTRGQFVGESNRRGDNYPFQEDAERHFYGNRFTGFACGARGRSGIHARCYDKWAEASSKPSASWVWEHWRRNGWDGVRGFLDDGLSKGKPRGSIWRLEFELGREVLKDKLGLDTLEDLFPLGGCVAPVGQRARGRSEENTLRRLWAYLTCSWLRVVVDDERAPDIDDSRGRDSRGRVTGATRPENRETEPVWAFFQAQAKGTGPIERTAPSAIKRGGDALLKQARGCYAAFLAANLGCESVTPETAAAAFVEGLSELVGEKHAEQTKAARAALVAAEVAAADALATVPDAVQTRKYLAPAAATVGVEADARPLVLSVLQRSVDQLRASLDAERAASGDACGPVSVLRGPAADLIGRALAGREPTAELRRDGMRDGLFPTLPARAPEPERESAPHGLGADDRRELGSVNVEDAGVAGTACHGAGAAVREGHGDPREPGDDREDFADLRREQRAGRDAGDGLDGEAAAVAEDRNLAPWANAARARHHALTLRDTYRSEREWLEDCAGTVSVPVESSRSVNGVAAESERDTVAPKERARWLALRRAEESAASLAEAAEALMLARGWRGEGCETVVPF